MRHLTGLHDIASPPGMLITPVDPELVARVGAIQGATSSHWRSFSLAAALDSVDEMPPSLAVAAPADPAEVPVIVKGLRVLWARQLVPLVLVLRAGQEALVVDAYANGVDFVVTPDVPDDVVRARARALVRLRTLTALLVESRERAKGRLETQSSSLRFLLEDIQEPISLLGTGLAGLRSAEGLHEEDRAMCDLLAHELRRVGSMTADLLDLQRLQQGTLYLERSEFDAVALVQEVVGRLRAVARGRHVQIKVSARTNAMPVEADAALVERVIDNLLANALRYAPPGDTIGVELAPAGRSISLAVSNGGPPIPPELRERIFDPYARLAGDVPTGGRGLGLAFCRAVMAAHRGNVHVTETEGRTRFVAMLPR